MYAPKLACGFIIFPVLIWDYNPQLTLNPPRKDRVLDDGPTPFKGTPAKSLGGPSSKQDKYVTVEYFGRSYKTLRPGLNWAGCTLAALTHWFLFLGSLWITFSWRIKSHRNRQTYWFNDSVRAIPILRESTLTLRYIMGDGRWTFRLWSIQGLCKPSDHLTFAAFSARVPRLPCLASSLGSSKESCEPCQKATGLDATAWPKFNQI